MDRTSRHVRPALGALVGVTLVLAACGDDTAVPPVASDAPSSTIVEPTTAPDVDPTGRPTTEPTTEPAGDEPGIFRVDDGMFVVDGVEVHSPTTLDGLPERATEIEYGGTLIDEGAGPMLCLGAVAESLPPQCGGPVVDGLEVGDWAERLAGVAFGERTVRVTWPPVDGHVALVSDREYDPPTDDRQYDFSLPEECAGISELVPIETLGAYAEEHRDTTATPWVADGRHGVLQVSGDIEAVRAELTTDSAEPCLQPVRYSRSEIEAVAERITPVLLAENEFGNIGVSIGSVDNRVGVDLAVADAATVRELAALVDDPDILVVYGAATIVAGK